MGTNPASQYRPQVLKKCSQHGCALYFNGHQRASNPFVEKLLIVGKWPLASSLCDLVEHFLDEFMGLGNKHRVHSERSKICGSYRSSLSNNLFVKSFNIPVGCITVALATFLKHLYFLLIFKKFSCLFLLQLEMEDEDTIDVFQQQTGGSPL